MPIPQPLGIEATDCLQVLHVRLILHHELLIACFCAGSIVRRRLPVLALGSIHRVIPKTISIVRLEKLGRTTHIHDLSIIGIIYGPESRVFGVRVYIACEVDNAVLEVFCEVLVDRGDKRGRWVVLFESC